MPIDGADVTDPRENVSRQMRRALRHAATPQESGPAPTTPTHEGPSFSGALTETHCAAKARARASPASLVRNQQFLCEP